MNKSDIWQYRYLCSDIFRLENKLIDLQAAMECCNQKITGMPGANVKSDKTAQYACEIADINKKIDSKKRLIKEIENYINTIDDGLVRIALLYKIVDGLSWNQVATIMDYSPSAPRMAVNKFLKE